MKLPAIILVIGMLFGCATASTRPDSIVRGDYATVQTYVTDLIRHAMKKNSVEGLSIALVDDQHIVWAEGFGYADEGEKIPASADTLYRVGLISHLFTDTAAMRLAEQGKFDIDQPLRKYIPDFSIKSHYPNTPEITLRQLMTHHSGLPAQRRNGFAASAPAPFTELVADMRDEYAAYPPNLLLSHSNVGISLLGNAIQNQSGTPFAVYMKQSLLDPLGMKNSSFDTGPSASTLMAKGYRGRDAEAALALRDVPAIGLNSSVVELSRFMSMTFADGKSGNRQILKPETVAEMLRPQNTSVPLDFNFHVGLGWMLSTLGTSTIQNGGIVAHHSGGIATHFRSQLYILPAHKLGVVVLSNSSTAGQVVDHIATETLSLALEAKAGIRQPAYRRILPDDKPLASETVQEYAGDYTTMAGLARIYACGKGLCVDAADHDFDLVRGSDGLFRLEYTIFGIFHIDLGILGEIGFSLRDVGGRKVFVARIGEQEMLVGQRIEPMSNLEPWRHFLGDYENITPGSDHDSADHVKLIEEKGFLFIEFVSAGSPAGKVLLKPLSDNEGILLGPLSDGGGTVRVAQQDGEVRVLFSGYQFRKIVR